MVGARKNLTFSARVFHRYSWGVLYFGINLAIAGEDIRINSMLLAMIGWHREDFNPFFEFNLILFMTLVKKSVLLELFHLASNDWLEQGRLFS